MAVFSRIVVLAAFVSTALFVNANPENVNADGQVTAGHLNHHQARAHHAHVAHAKRDAEEKDVALEARSSGGKAGLCWNDGHQSYMNNLLKTGKVTWYYTWSPWNAGATSVEFVPMLWSGKQISDFKKNTKGKKFKHVLGFNEPEISGQSEMSVGEACSLWKQYIEPMDAIHVAPAVTLSPKGLAWLKSFMNQCGNAHDVGVFAVHWYGTTADAFIKDVTNFHKQFPGKKIWVTEWACQNYGANQSKQCSSTDVKNLLEKSQAWLDSTDYIERYCWFGALTQFPQGFNTKNRLITPSGGLTDLGRSYIEW